MSLPADPSHTGTLLLTQRQRDIATWGGRVLWDPAYGTWYCLACLGDVPAAVVTDGQSGCCRA